MAMAEGQYGGSLGYLYRLRMYVDEVGVNHGANYSTVRIQLHMTRVNGAGGTIYNNSATPWSANVNGTAYSGGASWNLSGGQTKVLLDTYQDVGHNPDGSYTVGFSGYHNAQNSPYVTDAGASGSQALTTINRYTSISAWSSTAVGVDNVSLNIATAHTCDILEVSKDNGATYANVVTSPFSNKTFTVSGLNPATTYNFKARVRRQDSGLWTYTGTVTAKTLGYAAFLTHTQSPITDVGFTVNVLTDVGINELEYKFNGGSWIPIVITPGNTFTYYIGNLASDTDHTIQTRIKRTDSGLWTESTIDTVRTLVQNKFFSEDY